MNVSGRAEWRRTLIVLAGSFVLFSLYWVVYQRAPAFHARWLRGEDRLVEWVTFCGFLAAGVICLRLLRQPANRWLRLWRLGLAIFFLVCAGEEISWGQRILSFDTPEAVALRNEQDEFNLHNLKFEYLHPLALVSWALKSFGIIGPLVLAARRRGADDPVRLWFPAPAVVPLFAAAELITSVRRWIAPQLEQALGAATALIVKLDVAEFKEMLWGVAVLLAALSLRDSARRTEE